MSREKQQQKKVQSRIIHLNRNGLSYLTNRMFPQALQNFRQSEDSLAKQLLTNPNNITLNKLAGITYNNLACYYKKTNKPKVALIYLKKALDLEFYKLSDLTSTASTHLNICAIYSFLEKHTEALYHCQLAKKLLEKVKQQNYSKQTKQDIQQQRLLNNMYMLAHYNNAIELQHLKRYQQSKNCYIKTIQLASNNTKKNDLIILASNSAIKRIDSQLENSRVKLMNLLFKRRESEIKGNHKFMRKNKNNITFQKISERSDSSQGKAQRNTHYPERYRTNKIYQSVNGLRKPSPLNLTTKNFNNILSPKNSK